MSAALQIYYSGFDAAFFKLPTKVQSRIEGKIDDMGLRLKTFLHHRLNRIHAVGIVPRKKELRS